MIFFSYARDDGEFVLRLAQQLREAGADIWLDQLDIEAGDLWDREVEKALKSADHLIVVLSPTSVASRNVMDEVSYALEEGKRVIPVVAAACEIPFRLRRVQYIEMEADYESGFQKLLEDPDITGKGSAEAAREAAAVSPPPEVAAGTRPAPEQAPAGADASSRAAGGGSRRNLLIGIAAAVVLAVVGWVVFPTGSGKTVTLKKLEGLPMAEARAELDALGVAVEIRREPSERPTDEVIGTEPGPGEAVAKGDLVFLIVSEEKTAVPEVRDQTLADARSALEAAGLAFEAHAVWDPDVPEGDVFVTAPPAGDMVDAGTVVRVSYSAPGGWIWVDRDYGELSPGNRITLREGRNLRLGPSGGQVGTLEAGGTAEVVEFVAGWAKVIVVEDA